MTGLLSKEELAAIRERSDRRASKYAAFDRATLLAHLDAITAAVEDESYWHCYSDNGVDQGEHLDRDRIFDLLRGQG